MKPIHHISNTRVLGAPPGWDHGKMSCDPLPITENNRQGVDMLSSFWRPLPEELAALNAGGSVMLSISGRVMPPVMVEVVAA